jgi:hypothetical protein
MKILKSLAIIGAAVLMSVNGYSQGTVTFANSTGSLVVNSLTGQPAVSGVLRVGLYYNVNLTAVPNPDAPDDSFSQVGAFGTVGTVSPGLFISGTRTITEVAPGTHVLFQVRAWSAAFATYEEAYNAGRAGNPSVLVGASRLMDISTGGGTISTPTLVTQGMLTSFSVSVVPEPSMIALSVLGGLGAMVLLRRRK